MTAARLLPMLASRPSVRTAIPPIRSCFIGPSLDLESLVASGQEQAPCRDAAGERNRGIGVLCSASKSLSGAGRCKEMSQEPLPSVDDTAIAGDFPAACGR